MIWQKNYTLEQMNQFNQHCAVSHLGIYFSHKDDNSLTATMPVNQHTKQPFGVLHGGLTVALAETVGSMAGFCSVAEGFITVGSEINASHLRPVKSGSVKATASPIRLGKNQQVWHIDVYDEQQQHCCVARLTLSVIKI
ncbi:hotdog fold thioesterase [Volucribacter amazonae]|uniref:Esterase n=1 Tax=Volucribacter amazonae TaxID=256731 RepID=A0A9X4PES8_9PAST|nr:hotdog fold thioesterase [Volucribacter amazonae]MDG6895924.1 esterase [Volucribacter amazonae]